MLKSYTPTRVPDSLGGRRVRVDSDLVRRAEAAALTLSIRPPFAEVTMDDITRWAVGYWLERFEAGEKAKSHRKAVAPCVVAEGLGGMRWCPRHLLRWHEDDEAPESCRGSE